MITTQLILDNTELFRQKMLARGDEVDIENILGLDLRRRSLLIEVEELRKKRNELSKEVGKFKREGKDSSAIEQEVKSDSSRMKEVEEELSSVSSELNSLLLSLPNIIDDSVPIGNNEEDNVVIRTVGEPRNFSFEPQPHWDLGVNLGIMDFERGGKVAKSRFTYLKGLGARLERALINFMMDTHLSNGYKEMLPPYLVNPSAMYVTGQLPKFQDEAFFLEKDNLFLIPTSEVPVTNYHADEILSETDLPIKYTAYSACFRRESGSYGKDVRGYIRQHQFNKVELVHFSTPEESMNSLEEMVNEAELILKLLNLPYRVVSLCSGDIGFSASKTYDIEVWLPSQKKYREISSCSNCKTFQAIRGGIKYKGKSGKSQYLHTLNGSGVAVGRALVAILENYQQEDGSIIIPEKLRAYMSGAEIIS